MPQNPVTDGVFSTSAATDQSFDDHINNTNRSSSFELDELRQLIDEGTEHKNSLTKIPRVLTKTLPGVIEQLAAEYEVLSQEKEDMTERLNNLAQSIDAQKEVFMEALHSDSYSQEKITILQPEARSIIRDYVAMRSKINDVEEKQQALKSEIRDVQDFIENYGLKEQTRPSVSSEFHELLSTIEHSSERIKENVHVNLYKNISNALSTGNNSTLPEDLLELINNLVIERLENVLRPYEELSARYVSGELTHEQFTELLRKNALLSLLREKVIDDIIREYENNNLSSPIIPMRLRLSTERMLDDAKNFARLLNLDNSMTIRDEQVGSNNASFYLDNDDKIV